MIDHDTAAVIYNKVYTAAIAAYKASDEAEVADEAHLRASRRVGHAAAALARKEELRAYDALSVITAFAVANGYRDLAMIASRAARAAVVPPKELRR
ncbi:MAG: hypothetical protein DDT34_01944 [Firmicutes bacterium]|nr:hypothetical protein [Bacillota bacterium]